MGTGHFTQVVWKGSTELGIGKATGKKNGMYCTYIVGRYRPPGNFQGRFQQNVARGSFSNSMCSKLDDMIKDAMSAPSGFLLPPPGSATGENQIGEWNSERHNSNNKIGDAVSDYGGKAAVTQDDTGGNGGNTGGDTSDGGNTGDDTSDGGNTGGDTSDGAGESSGRLIIIISFLMYHTFIMQYSLRTNRTVSENPRFLCRRFCYTI